MFYTLQHTQTKPKVTLLLSRVGRTDPSISNIYTKVSIGIGSILARYLYWYFCFSSFLMFSIISVWIRHAQCANIVLFTHCTAHFAQPPPSLLCSVVLPSCDSMTPRTAVTEAQVPLTTDAITAHGREEAKRSLELFYCNKMKILLSATRTFMSIGFSIGINDTGLICTWYWIDTKFCSIAHHCRYMRN